MIWKYDIETKELNLDELQKDIENNINNVEKLTGIIETMYNLEEGQIEKNRIVILQDHLKKYGINAYINQYEKYKKWGFTPFIICIR